MDLIKAAGLPQAHKTGCWCCPMCPQEPIYKLLTKHPGIIAKIEEIELSHQNKSKGKFKGIYGKEPIREYYARIKEKAEKTGFLQRAPDKEKEQPYL